MQTCKTTIQVNTFMYVHTYTVHAYNSMYVPIIVTVATLGVPTTKSFANEVIEMLNFSLGSDKLSSFNAITNEELVV